MKRLLGLLMIMAMVGCGGGNPPPKSSQAKIDEPPVQVVDVDPNVESQSASPTAPPDTVDDAPVQAADADPVSALEQLGANIDRNELAEIVQVDLTDTTVTDAQLVYLKNLTKLESLDLGLTSITDAGLVHLTELTNLKNLNLLRSPRITDAGVVELQEALPNCKIDQTK